MQSSGEFVAGGRVGTFILMSLLVFTLEIILPCPLTEEEVASQGPDLLCWVTSSTLV